MRHQIEEPNSRNRGEIEMMVGFLASFHSLPSEPHGSSFRVSLLPSSVKKPFELVPRRRLHLAAGSTAAPVVTAASVRRHRPTLLLLMIILPLPPTLLLLSSVKTPSKLVPRRH